MKRLLLPLLTALALPTAVNAEGYKYFLLLEVQGQSHTVPMKSEIACEKALKIATEVKNYKYNDKGWKPKGVVGICLPIE